MHYNLLCLSRKETSQRGHIIHTNEEIDELVNRERNSLTHTRKLICIDDNARQPKKRQFREYERRVKLVVKLKTEATSLLLTEWDFLPSRSAPSSTSPMRSFPADDSSSNRESVLRSNARFSTPPLVGVLKGQVGHRGKGEKNYYHEEECVILQYFSTFISNKEDW